MSSETTCCTGSSSTEATLASAKAGLLKRYVIVAKRVVTCDVERATEQEPLGGIEDGAVVVEDGRIAQVGARRDVCARYPSLPVLWDARDGVVTPGFVDAHTHLVWAGSRHNEFVARIARAHGADYEQVAKAGGGIVATMNAVRGASVDDLARQLRRRLRRMASLGTTTCEVKSGYGLNLESELRQLTAVQHAAGEPDVPRVLATYLALHALPPEAVPQREQWIHTVANEWVDQVADRKLATFVDAYIDRNAFTAQEARLVFERAVQRGLGIRAHVGQFADVGGAALAASMGAMCVDHLENVSDEDLARLAEAGTCAVLLPTACFTLHQQPPPIASMRKAGVRMVVASDANPGTAPTESLPLALTFALSHYGLTPTECFLGATTHAAASLGLASECGKLAQGLSADIVVWDLAHEHAILQPWGSPMTQLVTRYGRVIHCAS